MSGRFLIVAPIAVIITAALFFLMRELIAATPQKQEIVEAPKIELGRPKPPPEPEPDPFKPPIEEPNVPPPLPTHVIPSGPPTKFKGPGQLRLDPPREIPLHIDGGARDIIRPIEYPSCGKGAGEAVLEYVVETDGSVGDIRVISATSSCFARAAERDARRWRYRPEVVDGKAVRSPRRQVTVQYQQEG